VAGLYTAGRWGRVIDIVIMRTGDILLAFPAVLLAIAIVTAFGPGLRNAMLAIAVIYLPRSSASSAPAHWWKKNKSMSKPHRRSA
jgi:ABC-type dipeptide/oligopeptide/nickel transport system permease subunit